MTRAALAALLALALAACGTAAEEAPAEGPPKAAVMRVWTISDALGDTETAAANLFNIRSDVTARVEGFANDPYKAELQAAMGTSAAPDIFFNWGGGHLRQYVDQGWVLDLTEEYNNDPEWRNQFLPSVLESVRFDNRYYGVPARGVQPVILFYNRDVFAAADVQPPETWDDLLQLVDVFNARGITPIALAGSQGWTELMYIEYLLDRIGGPEKFQAIAAGAQGAWRDPALLQALQMLRDLVSRGAFGDDFAQVGYDLGGASSLLATGEAAMHVMGSWDFGRHIDENPDFISEGKLGWTTFPSIPGGAGDPNNLIGNPSNYMAISNSSEHREAAVEFLKQALVSDTYINARISLGEVPPLQGMDTVLAENANGEYLTFVYQLVQAAPTFTLSWDQTLSASVSQTLLASLQRFFQGEMTPEQFVATMEAAR